jgi:hypothetical protein
VRRPSLRLGALDYTAIAVFLAVVAYTAWVAWDVRSSRSDPQASSSHSRASTPTASVQVEAPDSATAAPPLGPFRAVASKANAILVIGDSTGAGPGAWVDLVAQDLGEANLVKLHQWDEAADEFAKVPTSYGEVGTRVDIWNLSYRGVEPDYPDHLDGLTPPDVVLLDIGHDRGPGAVQRAVTVTMDAVGERWGDVPTAFVLQNPSVAADSAQQRRAVRRLTRLAAEYAEPVIDVYSAFEQAGPGQALVTAESRPTDAGSRLWADVVDRALGVPTPG